MQTLSAIEPRHWASIMLAMAVNESYFVKAFGWSLPGHAGLTAFPPQYLPYRNVQTENLS